MTRRAPRGRPLIPLPVGGERRTILIWVCVLIAVNQLGFGTIVPVVPLYAESYGVNNTAIGLAIAIYGLARFLVNVPAGLLADGRGRRWTLTLGGVLTVLGNAGCAIAWDYPVFLIARFVAGAGAAMVLTGGQIVVADIASPHNRGRLMSVYQGVFLFAVGAGPFPGGFLADRVGLAAPFVVNAALAAVVAALAWTKMPETRDLGGPRPASAGPSIGVRARLALLAATPGFLMISVVSFVAFFVRTGGLFNVIPIVGEDEIGLGPDQIGLGLGMISVVGLVLAYPSGALVDRFGRKAVIVPAALLTSGATVFFAVAPTYSWFLGACLLWSVASGVGGAAPAAYAADTAPPGMTAAALGTYRTIADSGYVVGPLLLGLIADALSPDAALLTCAVLLLGSGVAFAVWAPETLPREVITARPEPRSGPPDRGP
ncbi:MAG: MFS transporter [Chloroflexota bacterium]|nr:MFS transporter [Chloroflexota bacterium]